MLRRILPVCLLMIMACNRGPQPKPVEPESQAPAAAKAAPQPESQPAQAAPSAESPPAAAAPTGKPTAGGLIWEAPEPLVRQPPSSRMRAAQYTVQGASAPTDTILTVHHFPGMGGDVQSNLGRWIGQFSQPDGKPSQDVAQIAERKVAGMDVTTLDVSGTFSGGMPPMMAAGKAPSAKSDYRMLGAVAVGPHGPVFFKLIGPAADVEMANSAFQGLLDSLSASTTGAAAKPATHAP